MRVDTPFGPVWTFPDALGKKAAMHGARLELLWPNLEGFTADHTGPRFGGAWLVKAPKAALEARGFRTYSASENPTAEGKVWPPLNPGILVIPGITPEQLHEQDKRRRKWDEYFYGVFYLVRGEEVPMDWYEATNPPSESTRWWF